MYRNATTGAPLWQFNGNNFGYTFGRVEMTLSPGDTLKFASVGTFARPAASGCPVSWSRSPPRCCGSWSSERDPERISRAEPRRIGHQLGIR